jgi:hypothetical protein
MHRSTTRGLLIVALRKCSIVAKSRGSMVQRVTVTHKVRQESQVCLTQANLLIKCSDTSACGQLPARRTASSQRHCHLPAPGAASGIPARRWQPTSGTDLAAALAPGAGRLEPRLLLVVTVRLLSCSKPHTHYWAVSHPPAPPQQLPPPPHLANRAGEYVNCRSGMPCFLPPSSTLYPLPAPPGNPLAASSSPDTDRVLHLAWGRPAGCGQRRRGRAGPAAAAAAEPSTSAAAVGHLLQQHPPCCTLLPPCSSRCPRPQGSLAAWRCPLHCCCVDGAGRSDSIA